MKPPGPIARLKPNFRYELFVCALRDHELVGTDVAQIRADDAPFAREHGNLRWYRCLRCDSWLPQPLPAAPSRDRLPTRDEIELPLRGKALRDKIVLRLIAVNRAFHFVVLGAIAALIVVFASHKAQLQRLADRLDAAFYGSGGAGHPAHGLLHDFERLVTLQSRTVWLIALGAALYALLEGAEAVGLWLQKRWAEYLTAVATALFLPFEIYELTGKITVTRVGALVVNLAILVYLVLAKRLFGLRGGAAADEAARHKDSGWDAFFQLSP
jgi:uncharacterized membrane protein (DUF2068 family)